MVVRTKTMPDGNKARIIVNVDGETIHQPIYEIGTGKVWVKSAGGKTYQVDLSDKVQMTMHPRVGDTAVIKTFKQGWVVVDILPAEPDEPANGEVDDDLELQRQIQEIEDMWGGY